MPQYIKPHWHSHQYFEPPKSPDDLLLLDNTGIKRCYHNVRQILELDTALHDIYYNHLSGAIEVHGVLPWRVAYGVPWRDVDYDRLFDYLSTRYAEFPMNLVRTAVANSADDRSFHPVWDWLQSIPEWDKTPRLDTLFVDYLGAEDTPYVRAVTRKTLCAAVMRIRRPGTKFDSMPVLCGPQGIGKSTLISKLGSPWFSDSLTLSDMNDKTAAEKLQGVWLMEIGEMAGMKKAEIEKVKSFLSRTDDKYREPYGRVVSSHPRQCVFFGTTNAEDGFLRDQTGNRRFWTVRVNGKGKHSPWELEEDTVEQIWAEAFELSLMEPLYLEGELAEQAELAQQASLERDDRAGLVREYLALPLPDEWEELTLEQRRDFVRDPDSPHRRGAFRTRSTVSNMEIWCECFGKDKAELNRKASNEIVAIMNTIEGWERGQYPIRQELYGNQKVYTRRNA